MFYNNYVQQKYLREQGLEIPICQAGKDVCIWGILVCNRHPVVSGVRLFQVSSPETNTRGFIVLPDPLTSSGLSYRIFI